MAICTQSIFIITISIHSTDTVYTLFSLSLIGPPDKNKTIFDLKTVNLIMKCETIFPIIMTPKDSYGNNATLHETEIVFKSKMNVRLNAFF